MASFWQEPSKPKAIRIGESLPGHDCVSTAIPTVSWLAVITLCAEVGRQSRWSHKRKSFPPRTASAVTSTAPRPLTAPRPTPPSQPSYATEDTLPCLAFFHRVGVGLAHKWPLCFLGSTVTASTCSYRLCAKAQSLCWHVVNIAPTSICSSAHLSSAVLRSF